jgi:hypothetical protein
VLGSTVQIFGHNNVVELLPNFTLILNLAMAKIWLPWLLSCMSHQIASLHIQANNRDTILCIYSTYILWSSDQRSNISFFPSLSITNLSPWASISIILYFLLRKYIYFSDNVSLFMTSNRENWFFILKFISLGSSTQSWLYIDKLLIGDLKQNTIISGP